MNGNTTDLGATLRRLRLEKHLTQQQVAKQLSVTFCTYSRWECNKSLPNDSRLPDLANALGCRVEDLLPKEPQRVKRKALPETLRCALFHCKRMGDNLCCAACQNREECEDRCLNGPERCGQSRAPTPKEARQAEEIAANGTKKPCMGRRPNARQKK